MKKQIYFILLVAIGLGLSSSAKLSSDKPSIEGTWKLIEDSANPSPMSQLKHYTGTNFIWHMMNNDNIVVNVGAGKYKIEGDKIFETIEMATQNSIHIKGSTANITFKIEGDTLTQSTTIKFGDTTQIFTQKWLRVKE